MLNDARVASLGFFKDNKCTTRINKEKVYNQVPGPTKVRLNSAGLLYYINISFSDWVIVKNIIQRNVIINRGAAEVNYRILGDDIFDYHPIRECNIYFIIPNIRSFIFYRLRPTMVRGVPKGK